MELNTHTHLQIPVSFPGLTGKQSVLGAEDAVTIKFPWGIKMTHTEVPLGD